MLEEEDYSKQKFLKLINNLLKNKEKHIKNMKKDKNSLPNDKIIEIIKKNS